MTTYYVGIGGNDASAGTSWGARKLTLNGAEDIPVAAGDTVYVGPGTYRESLTVDVSGSAGNIITYIGDYTGANTSGSKGVVRITGSADDIALTRASCITATSKNYRTFTGFSLDLTSGSLITLASCTNWEISKIHIQKSSQYGVKVDTACSNVTIKQCMCRQSNGGLATFSSGAVSDKAHVIENCIVLAGGSNSGSYAVLSDGVGGITIRNCTIIGVAGRGVYSVGLPVGQLTTVNNCIFAHCNIAMESDSTAKFAENYNAFFGNATDRTTITAGANSVARPPLFDTRWFFEAVNGGTMITPFDLASYSTLVEYNSGTGAPSTDIRGASAVGTYREWGALEYNSTYSIAAGSAGGLITHPGMGGGIRG